jgi:hypothetical protein
MSTENTDTDTDDVAGHFQLPPETFDDDAPRPKAPQDGARSRISSDADDEDDVAGDGGGRI